MSIEAETMRCNTRVAQRDWSEGWKHHKSDCSIRWIVNRSWLQHDSWAVAANWHATYINSFRKNSTSTYLLGSDLLKYIIDTIKDNMAWTSYVHTLKSKRALERLEWASATLFQQLRSTHASRMQIHPVPSEDEAFDRCSWGQCFLKLRFFREFSSSLLQSATTATLHQQWKMQTMRLRKITTQNDEDQILKWMLVGTNAGANSNA